jgi:predicted amino acid-binding ACT domain protein
MNLGELLHIWRRRYILTAVLFLAALAGTATALTGLPRTYQSDSSVVLLASRSAAKLNGGNPYMSFSPSLTLTGDVLSRELMAPVTVSKLAARGIADPYTVALAPYNTATTGSVLLVTVTGNDKTAVQRALYAVTSQISVQLAQLQASVPRRNRIRLATISVTPQAAIDVSQTARPLVIVIAACLLLVLGIPVIVDARLAGRRIRVRAARTDSYPAPASPMA